MLYSYPGCKGNAFAWAFSGIAQALSVVNCSWPGRMTGTGMQEETGNYASAVLLLAFVCLLASGVAFLFPVNQKRQPHIISINRAASNSKKLQV